MTRHLLLLFSVLSTSSTFGQYVCNQESYVIGFEDPECEFWILEIDTVSNPSNIWHVGNPDKLVFTGPLLGSNAIVTDSVNPYPVNDISSFTIIHPIGNGFLGSDQVRIQADYQVDSDSLKDYGLIEFSPDNGFTWIDLLNDTMYDDWYSWGQKPTLTGRSDGWQVFSIDLGFLGEVFEFDLGDTIQYRFSFISDSVQTGRDGLVFDQFYFDDWAMGINDKTIELGSRVYPNPASNHVTIEFDNSLNSSFELKLVNTLGVVVHRQKTDFANFHIELDRLSGGLYYYWIVDDKLRHQSRGKLVVDKK